MNLSTTQRRYLLLGLGVVPGILNFIINSIIGWLMFHRMVAVPVWNMTSSAGPDTLGTCFFLPAVTCLIVTPIVRRHVRRATIEPVSAARALPGWLRHFHRPLAVRAVLLGLSCLVIVGGPVTAILLVGGLTEIAFAPFLWFKSAFAAVLGMVVTPLIGLLALADSLDQSNH